MNNALGLSNLLHPLAVVSFRHWRRLLRASGGIDARHRARAALITALSPLTAPIRFIERVLYEKHVSEIEITEPPVFIVGHWRTGTTHLHNLMTQDPTLAFVSTFHTLAPASYLAGHRTLRPLMALTMPDQRPMDSLALGADLPQEEEFAMCNLCPHSLYVGWYFPRQMRELFRKYVLFENVSESAISEWRETYLGVLKKATFSARGKRLVLKNPVNTGRIKRLLELFPDAKFIHIYRDPYVVFKSTQRFHRAVLSWIGLQDITEEEIEENVLLFFRDMMGRFFEERGLIPQQNFAEVRFEVMEKHPLDELARVYDELHLPGWEQAQGPVERYLAGQAGYKKHPVSVTAQDAAKVEKHWGFALERWGYERPQLMSA